MRKFIFVKSPGWDWAVDYVCADGEVDTMAVFGQTAIEDVVLEARRSLSSVPSDDGASAPPEIVAVRRI